MYLIAGVNPLALLCYTMSPLPIFIVSGLPRSGTSLMMQMLTAGGIAAVTDHHRRADDDNPRGYYEFERVKGLATGDVAWLDGTQGKVVKVISALLPHLPSTYPYRVLFMRRDLDEVLASQRAMLAHRHESAPTPEEGAELRHLFAEHLRHIETWLVTRPDMHWWSVSYNDLIHHPANLAPQIAAFCEQPLDIPAMVAVVDQSLYRNRI